MEVPDPALFVVFTRGLVFALALGLAIGALILRAAVGFSNQVAGVGPTGAVVPPPAAGRAVLIALVSVVVTAVMNGGALFATTTLLDARSPDQLAAAYRVTGVLLLPVNVLFLAAVLGRMRPTSFGRSVLVALFTHLIGTVFGVVVTVALFTLGNGLGRVLRQ